MRKPFPQTILESPDDDRLRLVYADWLEEHGEPKRAEFIRVQIDLERLGPSHSSYAELEDRQDELLAEYEADWLGPPPPSLVEWTFRRGFVEEIVVNGWLPGEHYHDLYAKHPARNAEFRSLWGVQGLAHFQGLGYLRKLYVNGSIHDVAGVARLLTERKLTHLSSLWLSGAAAGDGLVAALLRSPRAQQLHEILLSDISPDVLQQFCRERALSQITSLGLDDLEGKKANACLDVVLEHAPRWTALDLPRLPSGKKTWARFRECASLQKLAFWLPQKPVDLSFLPPQLTHLTMHEGCRSTLTGAMLTRLECLPNLRYLEVLFAGPQKRNPDRTLLNGLEEVLDRLPGPVAHLSFWGGVAQPIATLAKMRGVGKIRGLALDSQRLSEADFRAIAECDRFTGLRRLLIVGQLGAGRAKLLLASPLLSGVRDLELYAETDNEGVFALVRSPYAKRLRHLDLVGRKLDGQAVAALAEWPHLKRLREIGLGCNRLDGPAIQPLFRSPHLSPIVKLYLCDNRVGRRELTETDIPAEWRERMGHRLLI